MKGSQWKRLLLTYLFRQPPNAVLFQKPVTLAIPSVTQLSLCLIPRTEPNVFGWRTGERVSLPESFAESQYGTVTQVPDTI